MKKTEPYSFSSILWASGYFALLLIIVLVTYIAFNKILNSGYLSAKYLESGDYLISIPAELLDYEFKKDIKSFWLFVKYFPDFLMVYSDKVLNNEAGIDFVWYAVVLLSPIIYYIFLI